MTDTEIPVMTYDEIIAEIKPHIDEAGYTLEEFIEGCEDWTIRDGRLRDLYILYRPALI